MTEVTIEERLREELERATKKLARIRGEVRLQQEARDYRAKVDKARAREEMGPCEQCGSHASVMLATRRMRSVRRWCVPHADEYYAHRLAALLPPEEQAGG